MLDTLLTVATGGASGLLGSVISKGFSIFDNMQQEKKNQRDHERTMEMHRLDAELRTEERENELAIAEISAAADMRMRLTSMMPRWASHPNGAQIS